LARTEKSQLNDIGSFQAQNVADTMAYLDDNEKLARVRKTALRHRVIGFTKRLVEISAKRRACHQIAAENGLIPVCMMN